jgi:hypothetical protein
MAHFAEVVNGIVRRVIVAEQDFIDSGVVGIPSRWVQTSYNTYGGVHKLGGTPLRKNYAGVGYIYDEQRDAFIPPRPYQSWNLNEDTCLWESPIPYPNDNKPYLWNETTGSWEEVVREEE